VLSAGVVCAILAAGRATRYGASKAALELEGVTFIDRALRAAAAYATVVVAAAGDAFVMRSAARAGVRIVENQAPERGMTHSLQLGDRALGDPAAPLAVLLVDTPLVDADVLNRIAAASKDIDVAFPIAADGRPGHPVIFGARARTELAGLRDGDTLRELRDDARLSRITIAFSDERPFTDVDSEADYERLKAYMRSSRAIDASL